MTRTGVHSGLEKHRFHQAEDPRIPDLRKGDQTFVLLCIHKREVLVGVHQTCWLQRLLFPVKVTFFHIVIPNARLWFAFSPPSLCTRLRQGIDILDIELNDVKGQTFAR